MIKSNKLICLVIITLICNQASATSAQTTLTSDHTGPHHHKLQNNSHTTEEKMFTPKQRLWGSVMLLSIPTGYAYLAFKKIPRWHTDKDVGLTTIYVRVPFSDVCETPGFRLMAACAACITWTAGRIALNR